MAVAIGAGVGFSQATDHARTGEGQRNSGGPSRGPTGSRDEHQLCILDLVGQFAVVSLGTATLPGAT